MKVVGVSFLVLIGALACVGDGATTTASYLSASDRIRLKQVLSVAWDLKDLPSVHYAVLGYKLLGEAVPKPQEVCKFLLENAGSGTGTPELLYYVSSAWKSLASCGTLPVASIVKTLGEVLERETSTVPDLFFAVQALSNVGQKKGEAAKLIKTLQGALKKDDSLLNLGFSFHIAAQLGTDGTFAFDRIEDAIVQADEVDSRFLQFEGGLSITALLVSGAYKLADTVKKPPPITGDQAVKFANYFLSRRSVQTAKGAYSLLEVVNTLTNNKVLHGGDDVGVGVGILGLTPCGLVGRYQRFGDTYCHHLQPWYVPASPQHYNPEDKHGYFSSLYKFTETYLKHHFHLPVAITLASQAAVSLDQPRVSVRVSDLLGQPLSAESLTVTADSATRVGDEVVVLSKKKFEPISGDRTVYSVNIMETKPERGLYKLSVSAALAKPDPRLVGNVGASLTVKVMCAVGVENVEVGTVDADQTTQAKLAKVAYPDKLTIPVEADSLQKLIMKFSLKDKSTGKLMTVHQAFVKLQNVNTNQEIIFVAEPDSAKVYKFDIDVGSKASEFGHLSGLYSMELIVGDAVLSNSFSWEVADVVLKFSDSIPASNLVRDQYLYTPKPEIKHLFREPERRPPAVVSNLFTGLVLVPLLLLFVLWAKLGVNISNFPLSISAVGFHLGLGGIFILFGIFWLQLNMFQTIKYLLGIGVVTFLCGNKLLAKIASDRKQH